MILQPAAAAVAFVTALAALSGCGAAGQEVATDVPRAQLAAEPTAQAIEDLTCTTDMRVSGVFDHFDNRGGEKTALAATKRYAGEDELVMEEPANGESVAWVLRADGTAHTRLGLRSFPDGTWIVEYQDSCSGK